MGSWSTRPREQRHLALFELFGWLKYFREERLSENLSQAELFRRELLQIDLAVLVIFILMRTLMALAGAILR